MMLSKIFLLTMTVAAFSSCSTAYRAGQTPDDVYYSPARTVDVQEREERRNEGEYRTGSDYEITMGIRDRRWRDFRNEYDYNYSPYHFFTSYHPINQYYYNPMYYPWAIYTNRINSVKVINNSPRMVNLQAYNGYNSGVASLKTNSNIRFSGNGSVYNNNNRSGSRLNNMPRQKIEPRSNQASSNNSRTYTPSSSGSSGSSSSGSSGSVSRPGRGG